MNFPWKFWLSLWLGLAFILASFIITCASLVQYNARRMAELGYQKTTVPGSSCMAWQKVKKEVE